jgi:hypothetical protein
MAFLAAIGGALGATGAAATMTGLSAIGTAFSLVSSVASASQQASAMRLQAQQAELQGRQNALNYNRQANQVFERQQMLAATARARAAAAGVDPFTGSALTIQQVDAMKAGQEMGIGQQNAEMSIYGGLAQSQSLRSAAGATQTIGLLQAVGTGVSGFAKISDLRAPTSSASVAPKMEWYE